MPRSAATTDAARHLWTRAVGDSASPEEVAAAAEQLCDRLSAQLGRWIGTEGYRALVDRALGLVRVDHPALAGLSCLGGERPATVAALRKHSVAEVAAGLVALVATLIDLLGRIIGEDMALHLVEQIGLPSPRGVVSSQSIGGRDG